MGGTEMFARVTQYKMKPGSKAATTEIMNSLKSQIMGMPGMQNFINVANDDGSGYVISVVESEATSNANASKVAELWGAFSSHMEAAPKAVGYDVVANWRN
jgi:heme-degrading monooxygenase HmoA